MTGTNGGEATHCFGDNANTLRTHHIDMDVEKNSSVPLNENGLPRSEGKDEVWSLVGVMWSRNQ